MYLVELKAQFDILENTVVCFLAELDEKINTTLSVC